MILAIQQAQGNEKRNLTLKLNIPHHFTGLNPQIKLTWKSKLFSSLLILLVLPLLAMTPAKDEVHILILGDSLTDGFGVNREDTWPSLLSIELSKEFSGFKITNGGISGATTSSGLQRIQWYNLKDKPDVIIIALGSNDGLRGVRPKDSRVNIQKMIDYASINQMKVLLTGQKIPPNYGKEYSLEFEEIFDRLAKKNRIPLYNFLLEGVAGDPTMNLSDGIHPNENGHQRIAEGMSGFVKNHLGSLLKTKEEI